MEYRRIEFSPPDVGEAELAEIADAIRSGWITTGPKTKLFERRIAAFLETGRVDVDCSDPNRYQNRVVCLNSGTAAEELILRILGVGPGDEVIVPAYTYTATASAVLHCGAKVVFVDSQRDGASDTGMPEMDYEALEKRINANTKAIVAADLGGILCDYDRIFEIVERKRSLYRPSVSGKGPLEELALRIQRAIGRIPVISDSAHSFGASRIVGGQWRYSGRIGDFTSFSFHAVKNMTTAEGGAAAWRPIPGVEDWEIYKMLQLLSLHGQSKDALAKSAVGGWEYDVIGPWYKCNMTDIMAAIGLVQLNRYPELLRRRGEILARYDRACRELGLLHLRHDLDHSHSCRHLYLIRVPGLDEAGRNRLLARMREYGVSTNVHFKPLPMMTAYQALGWRIEDFPMAYDYYRNLISLPFYTKLTEEDVSHVIRVLEHCVRELRP